MVISDGTDGGPRFCVWKPESSGLWRDKKHRFFILIDNMLMEICGDQDLIWKIMLLPAEMYKIPVKTYNKWQYW